MKTFKVVTNIIEISGLFAKLWFVWILAFLAAVVLNVPHSWMAGVLGAFLLIEIPGALLSNPRGENNEIARTLSQVMQRIAYQAKSPRWFPVSWAAVAVFGMAGLLSWKTAQVVYHLNPFDQVPDLPTAIIVGATVFLLNVPHWWKREIYG